MMHVTDYFTVIHLQGAATLIGVGKALGDLAAERVVEHLGPQNTIVALCAFYATTAIVPYFRSDNVSLLVLCTLWGMCFGAFTVARGSLMSSMVPQKKQRGRLTSWLGGCTNLGGALGPLVGGLVAHFVSFQVSLVVQAPILLLTALTVVSGRWVTCEKFPPSTGEAAANDQEMDTVSPTVPTAPAATDQTRTQPEPPPAPTLRETLWRFHRYYLIVGTFNLLLQVLRASRRIMLPIGGANAGMNSAEVGTLTSVSFGLDTGLFWTSGILMDRFGRKWGGVPSCSLMGIGFAVLAFRTSSAVLFTSAVLLGIGNAMSSGIINVLGLDYAPKVHPAMFFSLHRFIGDVGSTVGPLSAGVLMEYSSFSTAAVVIATAGFLAALWLQVTLQEWTVLDANQSTSTPSVSAAPSSGPDVVY